MTSIRFSGLHLVNISGLSEQHKNMFGDPYYLTKKGHQADETGRPFSQNHLQLVFPQGKPAFPSNLAIIQLDYAGKRFRAHYSDLTEEESQESALSRYITAFERKFHVKIPHVFIPGINREEEAGGMFANDEAKLNRLPGLRKACQQLNALG